MYVMILVFFISGLGPVRVQQEWRSEANCRVNLQRIKAVVQQHNRGLPPHWITEGCYPK